MRGIRGNEIAMIFQEPMTGAEPLYTVGDQIAEVIDLHEGSSRQQAHAKAIELLARTGIPDPARRVEAFPAPAVGRPAPAGDDRDGARLQPKLLIADEPTTALDVTIQAQIIALLD
jgi:microcin C transport system ATP-binding protein